MYTLVILQCIDVASQLTQTVMAGETSVSNSSEESTHTFECKDHVGVTPE